MLHLLKIHKSFPKSEYWISLFLEDREGCKARCRYREMSEISHA